MFDEGLEVGKVFLDIVKTFEKVWHEDLVLKFNRNEVSGILLKLLRNFFFLLKTMSSFKWLELIFVIYCWSFTGFDLKVVAFLLT